MVRKIGALVALLTVGYLAFVSVILCPVPTTAAATSIQWNRDSLSAVPSAVDNNLGQHYMYAPSVMDIGDERWIWTCRNAQSGSVIDDIFLTHLFRGRVITDHSVLQAGSDWDSYHVCDPTVVRVDSLWQGTRYSYAMFYLGNDRDASAHNQVGVAFAHSPAGPWVRYPYPLVTFSASNTDLWGVGQPSATTINPAEGTVLLFWVEGYGESSETKTYRAPIDLNQSTGIEVGAKLQVTANGLRDTEGGIDWLNNADFVYDPTRDRFYAVREQHPYPQTLPSWIGRSVEVVSIDGASIWGGGGVWRSEGVLDPALTGYARNHNAGIVRSEYGTLPDSQQIEVVFTSACQECDSWLWSYRLHRIVGRIAQ